MKKDDKTINKNAQTWTIEHDLEYYKLPKTRLNISDRFKTTKEYTGDDGPHNGQIVGYEIRTEEPNEIIGLQYTSREIYKVWLDNGEFTVMWPNEIIKL